MPLPRPFSSDTKRRTPLHPVAEEDEFEDDNDDILSMLEKKTPTVRPKSASLVERKSSKTNLPTSKSDTTISGKQLDCFSNKQLDSMILDQLKGLNNDVQQILDKQQQLSAAQTDVMDGKLEHHSSTLSTALLNSQTSIISRISKSQSEVAALCQGIVQLKDWVESTKNHSGNLSESIESLVTSVAKHNEDLVDLTAAFKTAMKAQKTNSREQKESLNDLKKESNENRSLLEEMWASYEKDSMLLRKEQEALHAEKEKLLQERIQLEQAEALFEQRKVSFVCLLSSSFVFLKNVSHLHGSL